MVYTTSDEDQTSPRPIRPHCGHDTYNVIRLSKDIHLFMVAIQYVIRVLLFSGCRLSLNRCRQTVINLVIVHLSTQPPPSPHTATATYVPVCEFPSAVTSPGLVRGGTNRGAEEHHWVKNGIGIPLPGCIGD